MRVFAVDYGAKRIGLAVGDLEVNLPRPMKTLAARSSIEQDAGEIRTLVIAEEADLIVVGLPLLADGTKGPRATICERLADALTQLGHKVFLVDERHSTQDGVAAVGGSLDDDAAAALEIWRRYRELHAAT